MDTWKVPVEWRINNLAPIYENKIDIQSHSKYHGIKLISYTMKLEIFSKYYEKKYLLGKSIWFYAGKTNY